MTGWIIVLSIIFLLLLLLLSSLKIALKIDEKAYFKVTLLGFKLHSLDKKSKKPKSSKKVKAKDLGNDSEGFSNLLKRYCKENDKSVIIKEIIEFLQFFFSKFKRFMSHIRFKNLMFDMTVATDDSAKTAILYGSVCSAVYSLVTLLSNASHFDPEKISVCSDFTSEKFKVFIYCIIKIRLCFILAFAFSMLFKVIKIKLGEINNGRK